MKLVEKLARAWTHFPAGAIGVMQSDDGMINVEYEDKTVSNGKCELAEDKGFAVVTLSMWQKERTRIASEEKRLKMQNQVAEKSYENATLERERYERELWDRVAARAACTLINSQDDWDEQGVAEWGFNVADAFMAERAKRLRGEK